MSLVMAALARRILLALGSVVLAALVLPGSTESAIDGAAMSMSVDPADTFDCSPPNPGASCVPLDGKFDVIVSADSIPAAGYAGVQAWIQYGATGLVGKGASMLWPDGNAGVFFPSDNGTGATAFGLTGVSPPLSVSIHKGAVISFSFTCTSGDSSHELTLESFGGPNAGSAGSAYSDASSVTIPAVPGPDLLINCTSPSLTPTPTACPPAGCPTATATPTPTSTPTVTSTPTPTVTPTPCPTDKVPSGIGCGTPTATPTPGGPEMLLNVKGGDCDDANRPTTCDVPVGAKFQLSVEALRVPATGYTGVQAYIDFGSDLIYDLNAVSAADEVVWPACALALKGQPVAKLNDLGTPIRHPDNPNAFLANSSPEVVAHACASGLFPPHPISFYTGNLVELSLTCSNATTTTEVILRPRGDPLTVTSGSAFAFLNPTTFNISLTVAKTSNLTINCIQPPPPVGGISLGDELAALPLASPDDSGGSYGVVTLSIAVAAAVALLAGIGWHATRRRLR